MRDTLRWHETEIPGSGFTTGTCAAAAAAAAAARLCTGAAPPSMEVELPSGRTAALLVEEDAGGADWAFCAVQKDAGDDPDVTDKALVCAHVRAVRTRARCTDSWNDLQIRLEGAPCYADPGSPFLYLTGGDGVGRATKQGLSCPVGYSAINPVPRRMIFGNVRRVCRDCGAKQEALLIEISIPGGAELAEKTFNPRLGIEGGLSVLGTSGIVRPMSEEAMIETIRLEIRVRAAEGRTLLAMAPGNYGAAFLREKKGLSMDSFVTCSNFIGASICMAKEEGIRRVLLAGHVGKLIKVAGGVLNTHSRYGDGRMEYLAECALLAGVSEEEARPLYGMNTTEEAARYLALKDLLKPVMRVAAGRVKEVLEKAGGITVEALLFSAGQGLMAETDGADGLVRELQGTEQA